MIFTSIMKMRLSSLKNYTNYPIYFFMTFYMKSNSLNILKKFIFKTVLNNGSTKYFKQNMNEQTTVNEIIMRLYDTWHAKLKVPRTRDGHFHPQCLNVINETKKPSWLQCWKCMYQAFQLVKYQNCGRTLW